MIPSYAAYIVSDSEETEMHNAFALFYSAGMEIQWKRLVVGDGWKGSTAKYKGMLESIDGGVNDGKHKFDVNMVNISLGVAF